MQMNTGSYSEEQLVPALHFLAAQERGPQSAKLQVEIWLRLFEENHGSTWHLDTLKALLDALAVIAFANTAFRKIPAAAVKAIHLPYEIEDQGGFFVALKCARCILAAAPLCDDCLADLEAHVERKLRGYLEQVDRLLARR